MRQIGAAPSAAQCGDERFVRRPAGDRPREALLEILVLFEHQRLFRGEVGEERGHGHVGRGCHLTNAHRVIAALLEEPQGGVGDLLAGRGLLALPAPGRLGHTRTLSATKQYQLQKANR
jgi:hypothetical protein